MIYVDKLVCWSHSPKPGAERYFGNGKPSCHMWADPTDEELLHQLAESIGLRRRWYQDSDPNPRLHHYDLTSSKRIAALKVGAIEADFHQWYVSVRDRT